MARFQVLSMAVCCMLVASAAAAPSRSLLQGTKAWVSGVATFTGEANAKSAPNAACGYGPITADEMPPKVLALAGVSFSRSIFGGQALKGCGTCVQIRCKDKEACATTTPIVAMLHDNCDDCETNQINLQAAPFAKLTNPDLGRINIEYQEVPCAFAGGVTLFVHEFRTSGGGYVKVAFKNINGSPIAKAEIAAAGSGNFIPMKNNFGAVFEASRLPPLPLDVKLTNADGQTLLLSKALSSDKTGNIQTSTNF